MLGRHVNQGGTMGRDLVERAMRGDREAFGELAGTSLGRLVGVAGLMLGSRDAAEDAAQESLIRAWRDLPTLKDPDRFDAWLYRVLVRTCHDLGRREARDRRVRSLDDRHATTSAPDPATSIGDRDALESALRRLTSDQFLDGLCFFRSYAWRKRLRPVTESQLCTCPLYFPYFDDLGNVHSILRFS